MLIFSKLLSLVLSISLIIVSVMAFKGNSFYQILQVPWHKHVLLVYM